MRLLLDKRTLLWFLAGDSKLRGVARGFVEDEENEVLVSVGVVTVGSEARRLLFDGDAVEPSWSPHADRIAYRHESTDRTERTTSAED